MASAHIHGSQLQTGKDKSVKYAGTFRRNFSPGNNVLILSMFVGLSLPSFLLKTLCSEQNFDSALPVFASQLMGFKHEQHHIWLK